MSDVLLLGRAVLSGLVGVALCVFGARVLVHGAHTARWRRSLTAFELRLPRTATVEEVGRWMGTLRAMVRARRWWSMNSKMWCGCRLMWVTCWPKPAA
jgi:hypothetical protein